MEKASSTIPRYVSNFSGYTDTLRWFADRQCPMRDDFKAYLAVLHSYPGANDRNVQSTLANPEEIRRKLETA